MANLVKKVHLVKSDPRKNNNKFWIGELYDNGDVICRWGRVGDEGQSKPFPGKGESFLLSKIKEKKSARNGEIPYREIEIIDGDTASKTTKTVAAVAKPNLATLAKKQIQFTNPEVAKLIEYFTQVNIHNITSFSSNQITYNYDKGLFQTAMGMVGQGTIDSARVTLNGIANCVGENDFGDRLMELTRDYLMLIPQNIGRTRLDLRAFWGSTDKIKQQSGVLDGLQASLAQATQGAAKVEEKPEESVFKVDMDIVADQKLIDRVWKMYFDTRKTMHDCYHYKPIKLWTVNIHSMNQAFANDGAKMDNIWQLWHGSSSANFLSILSRGFVVPPKSAKHVTDRMFGDGIYATDISTKSLGYSTGFWGKPTGNRYFMLVVDMAMGKFYTPTGPSGSLPKAGYDSTFAKPGVSGIKNNEMIVYRAGQVNPKFLVEFKA